MPIFAVNFRKTFEFQRIEGEIYEVDQEKLMILDDLEAYPTLYDKKVEMVREK